MIEMPEMMTPEEVAAYLKVDRKTIYRYIRSGELNATRVGRQYRVLSGDLLSYLNRGSVQRTAAGHDMTDAELKLRRVRKEAMRKALQQAVSLREELRREMGGKLFPSVADLLHEAREDDAA